MKPRPVTITTRLLALGASVLLAACVTNPVPLTSERVRAAVEVQDSSFDAAATVLGPQQSNTTQRGLLADRITWRVRVHISKATQGAVPQLYVSVWHQDRSARRYTSASLEGGRRLPTTRIDYDPRCMGGGGYISCSHTETFGVIIPPDVWAAAQTAGLQIRLNSQSGAANMVFVSAEYVQAVTDAVAARGGRLAGIP